MRESPVSVVMAVCDMDRFLAESIESILAQTWRDFEFVIVDFGSNDRSKSIVARYAAKDPRIRLSEIARCNLPQARNAACSLAQGKYLAIMDADDVSLPDRLARQLEFMERHPGVGVVGGATAWIDAAGRLLWTDFPPLGDHEIKQELAVAGCPLVHSTALIRKSAFVRTGGYRVAFALAHDFDLWLRLTEHFPCANLEQVVSKYRVHSHQISSLQRKEQTLCKLAAQASAEFRRKGRPDPAEGVKQITSQLLCAWGVTETRQQQDFVSDCQRWIRILSAAGEYSAALKTALEALKSSDAKQVGRRQLVDLHLAMARLYWRELSVWKSFRTAGKAVLLRPAVLGRPLKSLPRRIGSWLDLYRAGNAPTRAARSVDLQ